MAFAHAGKDLVSLREKYIQWCSQRVEEVSLYACKEEHLHVKVCVCVCVCVLCVCVCACVKA